MGSHYIWLIVAGTLVCGAANSLFTKYQDNQCVRDCDTDHPKLFEQPAIQTLQMFVGELLVIVVYWLVYTRQGNSDPHTKLSVFDNSRLSIPAICDLCATTLLNIGLVFTPVSIYQMTRGALVLFVALLSVIFLKRRVTKLEWISLLLVTLGIALVGFAGSSNGKGQGFSSGVVFGISLVVLATLVQSFQFVVEEQILSDHPVVPLQLVYCEGFYGLVIIIALMAVLHVIMAMVLPPSQFLDSPFNIGELVLELVSNRNVLLLLVLIMISIAAFNYCGITLTHKISATTRLTVDTCRTLLVWFCALAVGWEKFKWLQAFGFAVLVFGTLCYNKVLQPEQWSWVPLWLKEPVLLDPATEYLEEREVL